MKLEAQTVRSLDHDGHCGAWPSSVDRNRFTNNGCRHPGLRDTIMNSSLSPPFLKPLAMVSLASATAGASPPSYSTIKRLALLAPAQGPPGLQGNRPPPGIGCGLGARKNIQGQNSTGPPPGVEQGRHVLGTTKNQPHDSGKRPITT